MSATLYQGSTTLFARDPRTGGLDFSFERPSDQRVAEVCARLAGAQPAWESAGFPERARVLLGFADALTVHAHAIAQALEVDTGRRRIARLEVDSVIGSIRGWAGQWQLLPGESWTPGRTTPHIRHAPQWRAYPLVAVISPWNFPLLLGLIDAVPALLAGCAVVVKPSEVTPRFAAPLQRAIDQVPELAAVFALLLGDGQTGAALIEHAACVCFTGSVATGREVAVRAAARLIPAFLELGGKDPLIVLDGSDVEAASDAALRGSVLSTGQACQSIERIYVARPIAEAFLAALETKARATRLNWPDIASGEIGPIIWARQAEILADQIAEARARGAVLRCGGEIEHHGGGLWLRPTILTDVTPEMRIMREETFGPVMPVTIFDEVEEAVALANAGEFGLSGAVFGSSLEAAEAVARRLEVGAVSLNDAALTAVFYEAAHQSFKASGLGPSRMGIEGLARFRRRKALIANTGAPAPLSAFKEEG